MHRSNVLEDIATMDDYIDDTDFPHRYNELVSFFCMTKEDQGR